MIAQIELDIDRTFSGANTKISRPGCVRLRLGLVSEVCLPSHVQGAAAIMVLAGLGKINFVVCSSHFRVTIGPLGTANR